MNSRAKGARLEREACAALRQHLGIDCQRGARNGKTAEDLDHGIAGVHFEVKGRATIAAVEWLEQAERDCGGSTPIVVARENRGEWFVLLRLADLPDAARKILAAIPQES